MANARLFDQRIMGRAEEGLEFIGNILESSTEYSIIGKDLDGKILLWNEGARRLHSYEPEEVVGKANSSILHTPEDLTAGKPQELLEAALKDGKWKGTIRQPLPAAWGDSVMLRQVFTNLVSNALKFTRDRLPSTIEIGSCRNGDGIVYYVKDNGAGFEMRYAQKLFGAFQRMHSEKEFQGTGSGVTLVLRIVHPHGGKVWAEAAPGEGATFRFTLSGKRSHR
jgi:light-regulated signal transduction histidine kinase (bacteriophytochrome)